MNKKDYEEYERKVARFFQLEGVTNLTAEIGEDCSHCCVICGDLVGCDPYFSHSSCDCCGTYLGGDRYHATGYNPDTEEAYCYEICTDCAYYAEYGRLGDMEMDNINSE